MSIYKRGGIYWYKFMWNGELIRESTKQGNDRKARNIESAHRTALANGLVGIREKKAAPALADFLKNDFVPFVQTKHIAKPGTAEYYADGANMVCKCDWASEPLDEISDNTRNTSPPSMPRSLRLGSIAASEAFAAPQSRFRVGQARTACEDHAGKGRAATGRSTHRCRLAAIHRRVSAALA